MNGPNAKPVPHFGENFDTRYWADNRAQIDVRSLAFRQGSQMQFIN